QLLQYAPRVENIPRLAPKFLQLRQHRLQSDGVGVEHRAAAIDWPAVAVDPDDVDVGRALCFALFENLRPFVDHRIDAALEDFGVADLALLDSLRFGEVADDPLDMRGGVGRARCVVIVEPGARLLAAPALLAKNI